jgi:1-acyl-sn-glycerol-3-phosphate acyltransferase
MFFLLFVLGLILIGYIAHQTPWEHFWLKVVDGWVRVWCRFYHRFEYDLIDLPKEGAAMVVSNHVSGLDPLLLVCATRRPLRFLVAIEEYRHPILKYLYKSMGCIPVDRSGKPEVALRAALRALQKGEALALFPQGRIVLPNEPKKPLKGGVKWLAQQANCVIYPVHLKGISGVGKVLKAVFLRSRAHLTVHPPLRCEESTDCLSVLKSLM